MTKLVVQQKVFSRLLHLRSLPADEFRLKCIQNGSGRAGAVDQNQAQTSAGMSEPEASQHICSGTFLTSGKRIDW